MILIPSHFVKSFLANGIIFNTDKFKEASLYDLKIHDKVH
jgi:hypothetical protein